MILTTGEIVIDCFAQSEDNFTLSMAAKVAGSSLNVAVALKRLGTDAGMLGAVSDDRLGQMACAKMQNEGLCMDHLQVRKLPSTLALVTTETSGQPTYSFIKERAADLELHINDLPPRLPLQVEALHFGSYAMHVEPLGSTLRALMWRESARRLIAYDLNVRPTVEPDMRVWHSGIENLVSYCSVIKASDEDIALIYPNENPDDIMKRWTEAGVSLIVITRGEKGLVAKTRHISVSVPARPVNVVDTVGAGDTVQGLILHDLKQKRALNRGTINALTEVDLQTMLMRAAEAASITCSRVGAEPPRADELERFDFN